MSFFLLPPIFCKGNHDNSYGCPALTASSNGRIWGFIPKMRVQNEISKESHSL